MKALASSGCAKGCFLYLAIFALIVVVTTVGLGGLRSRFGAAEVQGTKTGMTAQGSDQAAAPPQSVVSSSPDSVVPDGAGGGGGFVATPTVASAPPPPITQSEPQVQPPAQATASTSAPQSIEGQGGTITGEATSPFYIVQPGDSVWQIAHKFGVDMDALRNRNNIDGNLIYAGQVLYLPDGGQPVTVPPAAAVPPSSDSGSGADNGSGGAPASSDTGEVQDPLVPTMPNTGITSRRP